MAADKPTKLRPSGAAFPQSVSVDSSFISLIAYDPIDKMLGVRMKSGKSYVYAGVPADIWEGMKNGDSTGTVYNQLVKTGTYPSCEQHFLVFAEIDKASAKIVIKESDLARLCAGAWF